MQPSLNAGTSLRPEFAYGAKKTQRTGTAFVVVAKSGEKYLVTASHLYRNDEWPTMRSITLRTMDGKTVGRCEGVPLYVGKYTEDSPQLKGLAPDFSDDLMITILPRESTAQTLTLARNNPSRNDPVWVVGCEKKKPGSQNLYPCRVDKVSESEFQYTPIEPFDPWDFSGGPVVNQQGDVIGTLLAGKTKLTGITVGAIRSRFEELHIDIE
jgi:hypothetical protein